jgi:streptogramin lyase
MPTDLKGEHRKGRPLATGRVARRRLQRSWTRRIVILAVLFGATLGVAVGLRPPRLDIGGSGEVGDGPAVRLEIKVGGDLAAAAPGEGRLWVVNRSPKSLLRLDPATGARAATIFLPETALTSTGPPSVVVGSGGVWLAGDGQPLVRRVDATRDRVVDVIPLSGAPVSMALSPEAVWVGLEGGDVARISLATDHVVKQVPTRGADALATTQGALWVVSTAGNSVLRVDTKTGQVVTTIPVTSRPIAIATDQDSIWTANAVGTISRIDPESNAVTETLPISFVPDAITMAGGTVWVANYASGFLAGINPRPDVRPAGLLLNRKIRGIAGDSDGVVWVCTAEGTILAVH